MAISLGDFGGVTILVNGSAVAVGIAGFKLHGLSTNGANRSGILQYDHVLSNQDWDDNCPAKSQS